MHLQNPFQVLLGLSALLSVSTASPVLAQRQQQDCVPNAKSPLFRLRVSSPDNERLNNTYLVSSHSGPPYRQLVTSAWYEDTYGDDYVPNETSTRFFLNSSSTAGTYPCPGSNLGWEWNSDIADATLRFRESRTSNSWVAYLFPGLEAGSTVDVGFDDETNKLYLSEDNGQKWYRWAICDTVWGSYKYESLVWVVGSKGADNESCKGVDVVREWV